MPVEITLYEYRCKHKRDEDGESCRWSSDKDYWASEAEHAKPMDPCDYCGAAWKHTGNTRKSFDLAPGESLKF